MPLTTEEKQQGDKIQQALDRVRQDYDTEFIRQWTASFRDIVVDVPPNNKEALGEFRVLSTPDGAPGLNWLCAGLKAFYAHTERPMRMMSDLLRRGRFADEVMDVLAAEEMACLQQAISAASPDDPCPCGSGRKTKNCHGKKGKGSSRKSR